MARFVLGLAVLVVLVALWAVALWFVVRPDFSALSPIGLLTIHGLPPAGLWLAGWLWMRGVQRRREARRQAAEDADRSAQRRTAEAARQRQVDELTRRRAAHPVLAAVVAASAEQVAAGSLVSASESIVVVPDDDAEVSDLPDGPAAGWILPTVERVLLETLAACPAAAAFHVGVVCPPDLGDESVIDLARAVMLRQWGTAAGEKADPGGAFGTALASPGMPDGAPVAGDAPPVVSVNRFELGEHPAEAIFAAFDNNPLLPGMIVIAVDSPRIRELSRGGAPENLSDDRREHRRWHGDPAQAVVSLVVGNSRLGEMLASVEAAVGGIPEGRAAGNAAAAMRPYWDAGRAVPVHLAPVAALGPDVLAGLADALPAGWFHRPESATYEERAGRVGALSAAVRRILERGLVNAGVLPMPGLETAETSSAEGAAESAEPPPPACDWLVHNAGGIDVAGQRLAAVALAMHHLHIDLNPIDEATNFPASLGDLGVALPVALLAQAANKACETSAPSCWAHFPAAGALRMGVMMPANQPLSAGVAAAVASGRAE